MKRSVILLVLALLPAASAAEAQETFAPTIQLDSDAPEAWALRYFTSASLFTGWGPEKRRASGAIDFAVETIWVPSLDAEQRRVGYGGFKEEELNRAPVWARLRAGIALPAGFEAEIGYIPPLEIEGVKANLVSLALSRRIYEKGPWALGLRLHLQRGNVRGDFTCKKGGDHLFPAGSPENAFGCEAPSKDEVKLDSTGLELSGSVDLGGKKPNLYAAVSWNQMDVEFQVDALTFGFHDRTLLKNKGDTVTFTTGATWALRGRTSLGFEILYAPLEIQRPGKEQETDALLNARAVFRVPLR